MERPGCATARERRVASAVSIYMVSCDVRVVSEMARAMDSRASRPGDSRREPEKEESAVLVPRLKLEISCERFRRSGYQRRAGRTP